MKRRWQGRYGEKGRKNKEKRRRERTRREKRDEPDKQEPKEKDDRKMPSRVDTGAEVEAEGSCAGDRGVLRAEKGVSHQGSFSGAKSEFRT